MVEEREIVSKNVLIADFQYEDMEGTVAEVVLWGKVGTNFKNPVISNYWDDRQSAAYRVEEAEVQMAISGESYYYSGSSKKGYYNPYAITVEYPGEQTQVFSGVTIDKPFTELPPIRLDSALKLDTKGRQYLDQIQGGELIPLQR